MYSRVLCRMQVYSRALYRCTEPVLQVKLGLFTLLYIFVNGTSVLTFDERLMNFLPLGIYFATKFWVYYTWFAYVQVRYTL